MDNRQTDGGENVTSTKLLRGLVVAWRSGNGVGRINEVTLRRARLVLGWVTCPGSPPKANSAFHPFRVDKLSSEQLYRMCAGRTIW